jgi:hypothetical protein
MTTCILSKIFKGIFRHLVTGDYDQKFHMIHSYPSAHIIMEHYPCSLLIEASTCNNHQIAVCLYSDI